MRYIIRSFYFRSSGSSLRDDDPAKIDTEEQINQLARQGYMPVMVLMQFEHRISILFEKHSMDQESEHEHNHEPDPDKPYLIPKWMQGT